MALPGRETSKHVGCGGKEHTAFPKPKGLCCRGREKTGPRRIGKSRLVHAQVGWAEPQPSLWSEMDWKVCAESSEMLLMVEVKGWHQITLLWGPPGCSMKNTSKGIKITYLRESTADSDRNTVQIRKRSNCYQVRTDVVGSAIQRSGIIHPWGGGCFGFLVCLGLCCCGGFLKMFTKIIFLVQAVSFGCESQVPGLGGVGWVGGVRQ